MFTNRHSIVVGILGLAGIAVAYLMMDHGEQQPEPEAMATPRPSAQLEVAALQPAAPAPVTSEPAAQPEPTVQPDPVPPQQPAAAVARPSAPAHPLLGSWRCAFRSGDFSYPPMACEVARKGGGYTLEKTQGSQRIKGSLALEGDSRFAFTGLFFCPQGACDAQVHGMFMRKAADRWIGVLNGGTDFEGVVVTMTRPARKD